MFQPNRGLRAGGAIVAGLLSVTGLAVAGTEVANAAPGTCTRKVIDAHDTNGAVYHYGYVCNTFRDTYTYYNTGTASIDYRHEGLLYAGSNWVICQRTGRTNPTTTSNGHTNTNHWWLYTQGDVGYHDAGWGWIPATYVTQGGNNAAVPGVPAC